MFRLRCGIVRFILFSAAGILPLQATGTEGISWPKAVSGPGVNYQPEGTTFALWSPETDDVKLRLEEQILSLQPTRDLEGLAGVYAVHVPGDWRHKRYQFLVGGIPVRDPYGRMVIPGTNTNIIMDMSTTNPPGGRVAPPPFSEPEDAVIWEIHIGDFTGDAGSGVPAALRGRYGGMTLAGTRNNGQATGIDHLVELGVTHVQILPFYDFGTCEDPEDRTCYNWGYDPRNFNVPEERYNVSLAWDDRIREVKAMIDGFHRRGIRVIMDVVYNHTYEDEMFDSISPAYFTNRDLSGTGNSLNTRVAGVSRMIRDSLDYWVSEIGVDGFRFDLMGVFDYATVADWISWLRQRHPDRGLLIYGEPWNGYAQDPLEADRVRPGTIARIAPARVGVFNPAFREGLKGNNDDGGGGGFIFNQGYAGAVAPGTRGSLRADLNPANPIPLWSGEFTTDPEQTINYVSAHDNLSLRDKILAWAAREGVNQPDYLKRIQNFALGIVLTSQGIPFLHGGSEMLRSKDGDANSYRSSTAINYLKWTNKQRHLDTFQHVRSIIRLRRTHPAFRLKTAGQIRRHVRTQVINSGLVIKRLDGGASGDSWKDILVIYNAGPDTTVELPSGQWKVAMADGGPPMDSPGTAANWFRAAGTAVSILYRD